MMLITWYGILKGSTLLQCCFLDHKSCFKNNNLAFFVYQLDSPNAEIKIQLIVKLNR